MSTGLELNHGWESNQGSDYIPSFLSLISGFFIQINI